MQKICVVFRDAVLRPIFRIDLTDESTVTVEKDPPILVIKSVVDEIVDRIWIWPLDVVQEYNCEMAPNPPKTTRTRRGR